MPPSDLLCSDEAGLTQLILVVQLFFLSHTVLELGLQSGSATLHCCKLLFGIIQDAFSHLYVLLGLLEGLLYKYLHF